MLQSLMILFDCLSVYSAVKKKKSFMSEGKMDSFQKQVKMKQKKKKKIKCEGNTFCIL